MQELPMKSGVKSAWVSPETLPTSHLPTPAASRPAACTWDLHCKGIITEAFGSSLDTTSHISFSEYSVSAPGLKS